MAEASEDWRSKCLEAQAALRNTKKRVKIQTHKSRQLVAAVKQKLEEKDVELNKVRVFHDEQLHTLCQQLILIQSATYREQAKVQELLRSKEATIAKLRNEIISLKNSNNVYPSPVETAAGNKPLHPHRSCHGSFRLYKKELRDKLSASSNSITTLTKQQMAAATTSSEESEATIASPSSVARHNPLRQTLSLPQQSNSQLTGLESVSSHHSKVPLKQTLSCGGSSVRISMNKTNNTLLENSLTPTPHAMNSLQQQDAKSDSGKGDSSENETTDKLTVGRHSTTLSTRPKSDSSQTSSNTNCLGNLVSPSSVGTTFNASSDTCPPSAEPPLTSTPNRMFSGHRQISSRSSTSSSPSSSFDGSAEDSGIGLMAMSPIQSCTDQQISHVKQSTNKVAVPSAPPPPPVPPKVVRKKPMPPPRSSMTKLTTVSTTPLTRQPPVDRSRESIATVGNSAPSILSHSSIRSEELCRPSDSLLTDFTKLSLPHVKAIENQLNREPCKKGIGGTGRNPSTPSPTDTAKSSVASNHSSLSKTKDVSAIPSPAATGASFSKKTCLLNSSEVAEANHVALAARNSSENGGAPPSDVQPKKSILHTTSPSDASKALDNLIHNNKKGVAMSDNKSSTLKKKVKFHPELESSSSSSSLAAAAGEKSSVGGQARRPKESDPLDALLSQYSPKIVSRIGKGGENQDKISYFEPFI